MDPTPQRVYRLEGEIGSHKVNWMRGVYSLYKPSAREALVKVIVLAWERQEGRDQENFPKESVLTKAGAQYILVE